MGFGSLMSPRSKVSQCPYSTLHIVLRHGPKFSCLHQTWSLPLHSLENGPMTMLAIFSTLRINSLSTCLLKLGTILYLCSSPINENLHTYSRLIELDNTTTCLFCALGMAFVDHFPCCLVSEIFDSRPSSCK